jgi:hypothetical protein
MLEWLMLNTTASRLSKLFAEFLSLDEGKAQQ